MDEGEFDSVGEFWEWLENGIGSNFFKDKTRHLTDWELVVKLHAMIETALNGAIVRHLDAPELEQIIAKLDTVGGKVEFAKALKIIPKSVAIFIQQLSELRNFCVHDIRNFSFDLEKDLDSVKPQKRKELSKAINRIIGDIAIDFGVHKLQKELFTCTIYIMATIRGHAIKCDIRDVKKKLTDLDAEAFCVLHRSTPKES